MGTLKLTDVVVAVVGATTVFSPLSLFYKTTLTSAKLAELRLVPVRVMLPVPLTTVALEIAVKLGLVAKAP